MKPRTVRMRVPRVVAELIGLLSPTPAREVPTMRPMKRGVVIRQREQSVRLLADHIQAHPSAWGVSADADQRWLFASRLLEMRNRVRSCAIREAAEVAAL